MRDPGSIPELGRSPGEGNGNPLQYSYQENSWTEKPGGYSSRSCKDLDTTEVTEHTQACSRRIEHLMRGFELKLELIEK